MLSLEALIREAEIAHGHLCAGQILGVRLAMLGLAKLGIEDPRGKDRKRLVTFVEIDRCATDAISVVTGCRLGKRALKFRDWGKMAATFVDLAAKVPGPDAPDSRGCPTQARGPQRARFWLAGAEAFFWLEWVQSRSLVQSHPHRRQRILQAASPRTPPRNRKQKPAADASLPRTLRRRLIHHAMDKGGVTTERIPRL